MKLYFVPILAMCVWAGKPACAGLWRGPEVGVSASPPGVYSEATVAVSPVDSRLVIVGCNRLGGDGSMPVFVSRDRGLTFARTDLSHTVAGVTYHSAADPSLAFDASGNAYYAFMVAQGTLGEPYRPVVAVLKAGQTQWLGPFPATTQLGDDDKPWLAADTRSGVPGAGRVYMAWDRNDPHGAQSILVARSDNGESWQAPVRVDDTATSTEWVIYAMPAVGPNGEVYVVWNDYGVSDGGTLRFDRSEDGGQSFGTDVIITDLRLNLQPELQNPYSVYAIPAQPSRGIAASPSIAADLSSGPRRGWIYVCYGDRAVGKTHDDVDVFVRRSVDGGATWSAPVRVNDDVTTNSQFFPWMSVDPVDGSLNVCWYDCREDAANKKANVYIARSRDGGATFETNVKVTSVPSDQSTGAADPNGNDYGDYLGVAAFGGQVTAAWTDSRVGYNQAYATTLIHSPEAPSGLTQSALGLNLPAGVSLGSRNITLGGTLAGPVPSLVAEWEMKPVGTAFDAAETNLTGPVAYSGAAVNVTKPFAGLANGAYHWRVRALRADGAGYPGDWAPFSAGADFSVGLPAYTFADAARALAIAAGLADCSPSDAARLDVLSPGPAALVTLQDAVRICRTAAGLASIP